MSVNFDVAPAQFSARSLVLELFATFERRLIQVAAEDLDKSINKILKRNEDVYLDNLLRTLNSICETCLPSVLDALTKWYSQQQKISLSEIGETRDRSVKRTLAASYLFCVSLIEILPQIHFHPHDCEEHVQFLITTSFSQISYQDPALYGNNYNNSLVVVDAFAEVIGVLSQSHSKLVQKAFLTRLQDYRRETPPSPGATRNIMSLITGIKYFRIKTNQVTEFEMGVSFLHELGSYYLEIDLKQKDLKHRMAFLLVEILSPVSAQIKTEVNIPSLIAFVEKLYGPTYDLINKKQHKMAAYPLLTCLLCISQSKFFLSNWVQFLNLTLANLKNKDSKVSRMALELLYRLLWVYIIRNNCEGNTATRSRLESICGSLFPRGNRNVIPRDAPIPLLIKIIHVIAQQKLDFAFKEIIFDLLGCNRASRSISIYPERMEIGIRAFMVIADSLQQKEGLPEMSRTMAPIASGTTPRVKKYLTTPLTEEMARQIGLEQYYQPCRKAFDAILRALDTQIGRPFILTSTQLRGKEYEDIIAGDMKPKLDLFRSCVAAIPRLLSDSMSHQTLIEMLIRLSIHVEEELRTVACKALQDLITECSEWREEIIMSFLRFIAAAIPDTFPLLLESAQGFLLQLVGTWKSMLIDEQTKSHPIDTDNMTASMEGRSSVASRYAVVYTTHCVEGLALMMLCQLRTQQKKDAISLLKEAKHILMLYGTSEIPMINVLNDASAYVVYKYIQHVSIAEKQNWSKDFAWVCERVCRLEVDNTLVNSDHGNEYLRWDPWACALSGYCEHRFIPTQCPTAVSFVWSALFNRLNMATQFVDPSNPQNENRGSLLRSSKSKSTASTLCRDTLNQENYLSLWQKYLVMCCALAHPTSIVYQMSHGQQMPISTIASVNSAVSGANGGISSEINRSFSPNESLETESSRYNNNSLTGTLIMRPNMASSSVASNYSGINIVGGMATSGAVGSTGGLTSSSISTVANCIQLFQKVVNMLRWDNMTDMRDSVVLGIGSTNPACFDLLLEELKERGILREVQDKKVESNVRRRKRKDLLRLQLIRVVEMALFRGVAGSSTLIEQHSGQLNPLLHDLFAFIAGNIELDATHYTRDRDITLLTSLQLHFAKVVRLLIQSLPLEKRSNLLSSDLNHSLFMLFFSWCARIMANDKKKDVGACVELNAIQAMCALSCCGTIFESRRKNDEQYLYRWLEALLASNNQAVENICEETLCVVLHLNEHSPNLFERVLQLCYKESEIVASRCFRALAMLFSTREYPCEFVALFVLCQMFSENSDLNLKDAALQLLQILRRQFLDNAISRCISMNIPGSGVPTINSTYMPLQDNAQCMDSNMSSQPQIIPGNFAIRMRPTTFVVQPNHRSDKLRKGVTIKSIDETSDFVPISSEAAILHGFSKAYSQLTMPIFSEVCSRIGDARSNRQAHLLDVLLHWVENVELYDPNCDISLTILKLRRSCDKEEQERNKEHEDDDDGQLPPPPASESNRSANEISTTGSEEATQLLLNNMLYLTITLSAEHDSKLAALWQCIATCFPANLPILIHYLWIMITLAPDVMLPVAKKICVYLLKCDEKLVSLLMEQLSRVEEPFQRMLMRSEIPPYYRWAVSPTHLSTDSELNADTIVDKVDIPITEKVDTQPVLNDLLLLSPQKGFLNSDALRNEFRQIKQLPMPPYGGFNAKLSHFLPPITQPISSFTRNDFALFLLSALIGGDGERRIKWGIHMPTLIHMATIALDAYNPLIRDHARHLIVKICLMMSRNVGVINLSQTAVILINNSLKLSENDSIKVDTGLYSLPEMPANKMSDNSANTSTVDGAAPETAADVSIGTSIFAHPLHSANYRQQLLHADELFASPTEILAALVHCLSEKRSETQTFELWPHEDICAQNWNIESADLLSSFVRHLAEYFLLADKNFAKNWTNVALDFALTTTNRHLAARSFQVASALCQTPTSQSVTRILSRLVDLVDDPSDEAQSLMTSMMLCLRSITQFLHINYMTSTTTSCPQKSPQFSAGHSRSISYTTALLQQLDAMPRAAEFMPFTNLAKLKSPLKTCPSNRLQLKKENRHSLLMEHNDGQNDGLDRGPSTTTTTSNLAGTTKTLNRSKSATNLKSTADSQFMAADEESLDVLCQIFNVAIATLDSNVDNAYFLALDLLNHAFATAGADVTRCLNNLKMTAKRLNWSTSAIGIISIIVKGVAFSRSYEWAISLLTKCTKHISNCIMTGENKPNNLATENANNNADGVILKSDAAKSVESTFALIVIAVVPHCMLCFDQPSPIHQNVAEAISKQCLKICKSNKSTTNTENRENTELDSSTIPPYEDNPTYNLAMMMEQFRKKLFQRDYFQWAKCVVNYLIDAFQPDVLQLLLFLTDLLERNDLQLNVHILYLMNLLIGYGDMSNMSSQSLNAKIVRVVLKYLQVEYCSKEAARVLKSVIDQWNSVSINGTSLDIKNFNTENRTPHFDLYDERLDLQGNLSKLCQDSFGMGDNSLNRRNKIKAREKLVGLLSVSGASVGPHRSSSMIFSQFAENDVPFDKEDGMDDSLANEKSVLARSVSHTMPNTIGSATLPSQSKVMTTMTMDGRTTLSAHVPSAYSTHSNNDYSMTDVEGTLVGGGSSSGKLNGSGSMLIDRISVTTDSYPRVFKAFDFLEAEHDTVSESTDSCFNWLSTMRSPTRGIALDDEEAGEDENVGDENEDEDRDEADYYEEEDDNNTLAIREVSSRIADYNRRNGLDNRGSNSTQNSPIAEFMAMPSDLYARTSASKIGADELCRRLDRFAQINKSAIHQQRSMAEIQKDVDSNTSSDQTPMQSIKQSDNEDHSVIRKLRKKKNMDQLNKGYTSSSASEKAYEEDFKSENENDEIKMTSKHTSKMIKMVKQADKESNLRVKTIRRRTACSSSETRQRLDLAQTETKTNDHEHLQRSASIHKNCQHSTRQRHRQKIVRPISDVIKRRAKKSKQFRLRKRENSFATRTEILQREQLHLAITTSGYARDINQKQQIDPIPDTNSIKRMESISSLSQTQHQPFRFDLGMGTVQVDSPFTSLPQLATSSFTKHPIFVECNHHISGQVENVWNSVVSATANDQDGNVTSTTIMVFSQLLKESCIRLSGLLRDASQLLPGFNLMASSLQRSSTAATTTTLASISATYSASPTPSLRDASSVLSFQQAPSPNVSQSASGIGLTQQTNVSISEMCSTHFTHAMNIVLLVADLPILFVSPRFICSSNILQSLKFTIYDLREHFETFSERRSQCIRTLNSIKSTMKLSILDKNFASTSILQRNQEIELCNCLHKMLFQLCLMLEKLIEVIQRIQHVGNSNECNLSPAIASLQRELLSFMTTNQFVYPHDSITGLDNNDFRKYFDTLVLHVVNRQLKSAYDLLHRLRNYYGSEFGCCDQADVDALLVTFCRGHSSLRAWALISGTGNPTEVVSQLTNCCILLRDNNVQLATLIRSFIADTSLSSSSSPLPSQFINTSPSINPANASSILTNVFTPSTHSFHQAELIGNPQNFSNSMQNFSTIFPTNSNTNINTNAMNALVSGNATICGYPITLSNTPLANLNGTGTIIGYTTQTPSSSISNIHTAAGRARLFCQPKMKNPNVQTTSSGEVVTSIATQDTTT